eukprot:269441_1
MSEFLSWKQNYITQEKRELSVGINGTCWEFIRNGYCSNLIACPYQHTTKSEINVNEDTKDKKETREEEESEKEHISEMRIEFGKHKGKHLHELPKPYIMWLKNRSNILSNKPRSFVMELKRAWPSVFEE